MKDQQQRAEHSLARQKPYTHPGLHAAPKASRTTIWHALNRQVHHQINQIMSSINRMKTRMFPGADIGNDYD
ncbi:hypothetical protein DPMN_191576 [Dreissena polymorpha]|uniref:Uncharacterized protein n=1 Tax=Dreissena polymorpha TaxID=45954 RepID=A0A9D4B7L3_DREPO|nr:hypothetical protein DPMN_191576 [Dreissena polymorpha]